MTEADAAVLERVQQRAVRMTSGLRCKTYEEKLREAKMLSLAERRVRGDMLETWKVLADESRSGLLLRADSLSERVTRGTTSKALVKESRINLDIRRNFFTNRVVNPWNALPTELRNAKTFESFKLGYDKHVFPFFFQ